MPTFKNGHGDRGAGLHVVAGAVELVEAGGDVKVDGHLGRPLRKVARELGHIGRLDHQVAALRALLVHLGRDGEERDARGAEHARAVSGPVLGRDGGGQQAAERAQPAGGRARLQALDAPGQQLTALGRRADVVGEGTQRRA